ncbi:hypothetical protein D3C78_1837630 [compost metagenome]
MEKIGELYFQALVVEPFGGVADIVVRAHGNQVVGLGEKAADGLDLGCRGVLAGA